MGASFGLLNALEKYSCKIPPVSNTPMKKISHIAFLFLLLILTACAGKNVTPAAVTPAPQPTATKVRVLPTPSTSGDQIVWQNLQVTMEQAEITDSYVTDFGTTRIPTNNEKFLWVHVRLKNVGQEQEINLPLPENFSALYAAAELKPVYGHRQGYMDFTTLKPLLFPNEEVDAWLRFDVPAAAELKDLRFIFLPESSKVGASFSSPNYPYADDKPTFVWKCIP
jgi:hypothetical protein